MSRRVGIRLGTKEDGPGSESSPPWVRQGPEISPGGQQRKVIARAMYHPDILRHPDSCPALVLNADYTPLSYYPLSLWSWQDAIKAVFLDRVNIVEHYDRAVRSPSFEIRLPSVVSLKSFVKPTTHPAFTRFNLFLRDRFACQYCGSGQHLTFDHVIPRRMGGRTSWENIATACAPCNMKKGGRTPQQAHMQPLVRPIRPTSWQLQQHGKSFPPNYLHETWRDWLYWDIELEE